MSAYVKTIISRSIRDAIAKAAEAMEKEAKRLSKENELRAQVERSLALREEANARAAKAELAGLNQAAFDRLRALVAKNAEAKAILAENLQEVAPEPLKEESSKKETSKFSAAQLEMALATRKILGYYAELEKINPAAAKEKAPLTLELEKIQNPNRLAMVADSLKAALAREIAATARTFGLRAELMAIQNNTPKIPESSEFLAEIAALLAKPAISDEEMASIREKSDFLRDLAEQKHEAEFLKKTAGLVQSLLANEGYEVFDSKGLSVGSQCLVAPADSDYPVLVNLDNDGAYTFQQLKLAQSKEDGGNPPDDYQLALDREKTEAFCQAHDRLAKALREAGLNVDTKVLKGPGEGPLPLLVSSNYAERAKKRAQAENKALRQREEPKP
jgi:hypothetical protein